MIRAFAVGAAALILAPLLLAGPTVADEVVVRIERNRFDPARVAVRPGDIVVWLNAEKRTSHDVVFADGVASERLMPEERFARRFDAPGSHPYRCTPHPDMRGEVVVEP
ncbi:cupredoxin domain-containing protein [Azospirillum aestuarii]|uniref:cupredoxin domain-containing protein n=1 Tax=Azospirillum aestuarii TaxID=2802052 RepID=UPI004054F367